EPDGLLDLVDAGVERLRVGDVDARDPQVAGVEADAEAWMAAEPLDEGCELSDRPPDRPARAGGVLDQEPARVRAVLEPRQARGLCVKICTDSAPICSARSMAVWIPPDVETWAPGITALR